VSPSPKTANDRSSKESVGNREESNLFHKGVMERGSIPEPVVDTTKITSSSMMRFSCHERNGFRQKMCTIMENLHTSE